MMESRCGILCSACEYQGQVGCKGCLAIPKPFWGEVCPLNACCEGRGLAVQAFRWADVAEGKKTKAQKDMAALAEKLRTQGSRPCMFGSFFIKWRPRKRSTQTLRRPRQPIGGTTDGWPGNGHGTHKTPSKHDE